jgi:hypothetical protein
MSGLVCATKSIVYVGGMATGVALVFAGWWLRSDPNRYDAVASGQYTSVENQEKRFFETDGREYRYWLSKVGISFTVNGATHSFKETFRVYEQSRLPIVGGRQEVRYSTADPNDATTRAVVKKASLPVTPTLMLVLGILLIIALNTAMIVLRDFPHETSPPEVAP